MRMMQIHEWLGQCKWEVIAMKFLNKFSERRLFFCMMLGVSIWNGAHACEVMDYKHTIASSDNVRYALSLFDTTTSDNWSTRQKDISAFVGKIFASFNDFEKYRMEYRRTVKIDIDAKRETSHLETYLDQKGLDAYLGCLHAESGLAIVAVNESGDDVLFRLSLASKTPIEKIKIMYSGDGAKCIDSNHDIVNTLSLGGAQAYDAYILCTLTPNTPFTITASSEPHGFAAATTYVVPRYAKCARSEFGIAYDEAGRPNISTAYEKFPMEQQKGWHDDTARKYFWGKVLSKYGSHSDVKATWENQYWYRDDHDHKSTRGWEFAISYDPTYETRRSPLCGLDDSPKQSVHAPPSADDSTAQAKGAQP